VDKTPAIKLTGPVTVLLAVARVTPRVLLIARPPVPLNVAGNSGPVVCAAEPLYCSVAAAP